MNFDRNTIIGFVLLGILFTIFFWYTSQQQANIQRQKLEQAKNDSIRNAAQQPRAAIPATEDTGAQTIVTTIADSADLFFNHKQGEEKLATVETPLMKVRFSNKGGQPVGVELKKFEGTDSSRAKLAASNFDKFSYAVRGGENKTDSITDLYFSGGEPVKNADGSFTVNFQLQSAKGSVVEHQYIIRPDQYMIDFNLVVKGGDQLFANNTLPIVWQNRARQLQKDMSYERQMSEICFYADGEYDYYNIASRTQKEFSDPVQWVAVKQQFFNSALVSKEKAFTAGRIDWNAPSSGETVVEATASLRYNLPGADATIPLGLYYGPTDYKILKQYGYEMEDMVNLGSGIFAFVKYINRFIVIPVFDFFSKLTSNYGIVILLLTLFIRLLISPLTYKSYLSGAKMKVLRPEIEQLKAKYGGDQQQMSMEQMKLFREAGVNPLGGCIPALLQIPIFFALYSFFNSNVALRGQSFLWADDLSQFDSVFEWSGWAIPFYGSHISLFTITAVVTSLLISLYSMSMTPDQSNPVLKYMPYIFPVILLFVFNKLPSGLTWYYTVSNIITLALQFVIQNYIINHEKILAKIEANRKKPKTKSKWQERLEQIQEQQKQMRETQNKNRR